MIKKVSIGIVLGVSCFFLIQGFKDIQSDEKANTNSKVLEEQKENIDIKKISCTFGHLIGKNLEVLGVELDIEHLIEGLKDSFAGKKPPMSESECTQIIAKIQENILAKKAEANLKIAEDFLSSNKNREGVRELENGKLQFKIEKEGTGAVIEEHFSPTIRYTGKFLDGKILGSSQEDQVICLDETIPGLSKGILGMKEGELRTLYIHPDLAYGTTGYIPPNSLLTFEVQLIKANTPIATQQEASSSNERIDSSKATELAADSLEENAVIR